MSIYALSNIVNSSNQLTEVSFCVHRTDGGDVRDLIPPSRDQLNDALGDLAELAGEDVVPISGSPEVSCLTVKSLSIIQL